MPVTETDICRLHVTPRLREAGWETEPHFLLEQKPITDGRIIPKKGNAFTLLDKYAEHGPLQFKLPDALKAAPLSDTATLPEIIALFGGADALLAAVNEMQQHLYAA